MSRTADQSLLSSPVLATLASKTDTYTSEELGKIVNALEASHAVRFQSLAHWKAWQANLQLLKVITKNIKGLSTMQSVLKTFKQEASNAFPHCLWAMVAVMPEQLFNEVVVDASADQDMVVSMGQAHDEKLRREKHEGVIPARFINLSVEELVEVQFYQMTSSSFSAQLAKQNGLLYSHAYGSKIADKMLNFIRTNLSGPEQGLEALIIAVEPETPLNAYIAAARTGELIPKGTNDFLDQIKRSKDLAQNKESTLIADLAALQPRKEAGFMDHLTRTARWTLAPSAEMEQVKRSLDENVPSVFSWLTQPHTKEIIAFSRSDVEWLARSSGKGQNDPKDKIKNHIIHQIPDLLEKARFEILATTPPEKNSEAQGIDRNALAEFMYTPQGIGKPVARQQGLQKPSHILSELVSDLNKTRLALEAKLGVDDKAVGLVNSLITVSTAIETGKGNIESHYQTFHALNQQLEAVIAARKSEQISGSSHTPGHSP